MLFECVAAHFGHSDLWTNTRATVEQTTDTTGDPTAEQTVEPTADQLPTPTPTGIWLRKFNI